MSRSDIKTLTADIKNYAKTLGFVRTGIAQPQITHYTREVQRWLQQGYAADMSYMHKHLEKRLDPSNLLPNTKSIICAAFPYAENISDSTIIANYARGKDYHIIVRERLKQLAEYIKKQTDLLTYTIFVDTAPVLEKSLAQRAGLGWIGKNTLITHKNTGSFVVLGEIFIDVELLADTPARNDCGDCTKCLDACPTNALVSDNQLDARRCISYLTIEHRGSIPIELRTKIGQRVFGCDACQTICPWNIKISTITAGVFSPKQEFTTPHLVTLFLWDEKTFKEKTRDSAIQRLGHECWLRNIAIALGNSLHNMKISTHRACPELIDGATGIFAQEIIDALTQRLNHPSGLVREHVIWALSHKTSKYPTKI